MNSNPLFPKMRSTKLLDLPNELLSRVIHFTIPQLTICPSPQPVPLDSTNVAFTCKRLYNLVKYRLSTLDFLSPASPVTHVTKAPRPSSKTIERFTKLASPFLEVLRLPIHFEPTSEDMSSVGSCRNLKELCIPITYEISVDGAEKFLIPLKKLVNLTITNPRTPIFEVLTMPPWKLRQLNIVSLVATAANRDILEQLLKIGSLESLTVAFRCSGTRQTITPYNCDDPHHSRSFPETLMFLSQMLKRNKASLQSLRHLSIATNDHGPHKRAHRNDGGDVNRMIEEVNDLRRIINTVRADGDHHFAYLNLTQLQLRMYPNGATDLGSFMKGLLSLSTEIVITFENLIVSYPGTIKDGTFPRPVVTDLKLFFHDEHWALKENVNFKTTSISVLRKQSAEMITRQLSRRFLTYALQGSVESIRMSYLPETWEEIQVMLKALYYITCFTPGVKLLALPVSIIAKSDLITVDDLQKIKCAANLRILWLDFTSSVELQPDPLGTVYLDDASIDFYSDNDVAITDRLPDFLDKIKNAFPKLTHIFCERTVVLFGVEAVKIRRAEKIVMDFEKGSGIDASSLRQEIRYWAKKERPDILDMEKLREGFERLRELREARERAIAAAGLNLDGTPIQGSSSTQTQ